MELPGVRRRLNRVAVRTRFALMNLGLGAFLLLVFQAGADEPYKRMLDDPLTFTGTETLDSATTEAEYRIGVFAPDGDDHPVGRDLVRGVRLAVEQANVSGGVNGKPLRIVRRWAEDPWGAGSKEVIRMVFDDRVWALIGGPDGETTHVAQQVATKAHLPLIAPVSSDPSLTHTRVPWIFRLPPDDAAQAEALVKEGLAPRSLSSACRPTMRPRPKRWSRRGWPRAASVRSECWSPPTTTARPLPTSSRRRWSGDRSRRSSSLRWMPERPTSGVSRGAWPGSCRTAL